MVASTAVAHRIPAGWYRDRDDSSRRRWWNGTEWTSHYAPAADPLTASTPTTRALTPVESLESSESRMLALLESIGSRVERAIAPQPQQPEHDKPGSPERPGQAEHVVLSPATSVAIKATTIGSAHRRIPLAVIVLLAALTGANTVLLGILASGR